MKILNVNSCLGLQRGAGTAERTYQMSRFLARTEDAECAVLTLDLDLSPARLEGVRPATVTALPVLNERFYVPRSGFIKISSLVKAADIVHLMGHWDFLNVLVFLAVRWHKKKYVICPAGALPVYGRSRLLKKTFNFLIGRRIVRGASVKIAVTKLEVADFIGYGVHEREVTILPNGIDTENHSLEDLGGFERLASTRYILFMGRLNLIKGPDILLEGFFEFSKCCPGYRLVFAGPDGGMLNVLSERVCELGLTDQVDFIGYLDGHVKSSIYKRAEVMVVPSRQEAMSIVALEAAAQGTAVIVSDKCGLSEIKLVHPKLEVPLNAQSFADALKYFLSDSELLAQVSSKWMTFVTEHYSWEKQANKYLDLYKQL